MYRVRIYKEGDSKMKVRVQKDGEPRNQVPEEGFKSGEGLHKILIILLSFFRIYMTELLESYAI